ncbi:MAG: VanZ family protein [Candidatus Wallbacteria bacterium]
MKNFKFTSLIYALIIVWAFVIYCFSSQSGTQSAALSEKTLKYIAKFIMPDFEKLSLQTQNEILNEMGHRRIRKIAHILLYAVFAILIMTALNRYESNFWQKCLVAIMVCIIYAVLDEWHQYYVKGRASQTFDIAVDALGAFIGSLLFMSLNKIGGYIKMRQ